MKRKWVRTSVPLGETRLLRLGDVRMESYGEKLTEVLARPDIPKRREAISLILHLGLPAVLAEVSTTVMQYIDTAMVGSLGANASAAIGVVQTTTWLLFGCCECAALGFSIQVAQFLGAGRDRAARNAACQGLVVCSAFSLVIAFVGMALSKSVPRWLGGPAGVLDDAAGYFFFMSAFMPVVMLQRYGALMLQCTGDMATPSIINVVSCFLDVVFNFLLIMPGAVHSLGGVSVFVPGAGMGVRGAAAGTGVATAAAAFPMLWFVFGRSGRLSLRRGASWTPGKPCLRSALVLSAPLFLERFVMNGAYIAQTIVVAPLGTIAVAANSIATTAESVCYMPGYGLSQAATTLVGQAFGSGRRDMAKAFGNYSALLGVLLMGAAGGMMWLLAPQVMAILSSDPAVSALGCSVLRIEAFAEPLYGAAMVIPGGLRGAGDTVAPSLINLGSMWAIRIPLMVLLAPRLGLVGIWSAMCIELNARGCLMLARLLRGRWLNRSSVTETH
jgi:putative MATE family efflux protein